MPPRVVVAKAADIQSTWITEVMQGFGVAPRDFTDDEIAEHAAKIVESWDKEEAEEAKPKPAMYYELRFPWEKEPRWWQFRYRKRYRQIHESIADLEYELLGVGAEGLGRKRIPWEKKLAGHSYRRK